MYFVVWQNVYDGRRLYGRTLLLWTVVSKFPVYFRHFRYMSKIPVYFRTGVLNLSFGKIFGKFREIFGRSKPLFYFGWFSTVENFRLSTIGNSRKSKISVKRMALVCIVYLLFSSSLTHSLSLSIYLSLTYPHSITLSLTHSLLHCPSLSPSHLSYFRKYCILQLLNLFAWHLREMILVLHPVFPGVVFKHSSCKKLHFND